MRKVLSIFFLLLLSCVIVVAQDDAKAEVFGGYQWTNVGFGGGSDRINFNGWNAAVTGYMNKSFGITGDISGAYKSEGGASLKLHSFMFGPTVRVPMEKATPFVHALFGATRANAAFAGTGESDNAFSYALGGGLDVNAGKSVAVRVGQFDYVGTHFGGENQKNFRYSAGIVFKF